MSFMGGIIGVVTKVANTAWAIIKVAKPILEALRPAVAEVELVMSKFEEGISAGEIAADDFLDRNIHVIQALESVSGKGIGVMQQFNTICVKLRVYSQEQTPDRLTEEEVADLVGEFGELRTIIAQWGDDLDVADAALATLDE